MSPVYFQPKLFRDGNMEWLLEYNPIYHLLQIMRAPLLHAQFPQLENILFSIRTIIVLAIIALLVGVRCEKRVLFYL